MAEFTLKSSHSLPPPSETDLTVPQYLIERANAHAKAGKSVWMIDSKSDERIYFKDFDRFTRNVASWLYKNGMTKKGDTLIYLNYNYTKEHLIFNGVWRANGLVRASYPQDTKETLLSRVLESEAKFLYCEVESAAMCLDIAKKVSWTLTVIVTGRAEGCVSIDDILLDDGQSCPDLKITANDPAIILCTSGTTGKSKGAIRTHRSVLQVIQSHQFCPWQEITVTACSGTHISGSLFPMGNLVKGVTNVAVYQLTKENLFQAVHKYRPKYLHAFPTFLLAMVNDEGAKKYDFSSVEYIFTGGVIISPPIRAQLMGLPGLKYILNMYGLTETLYSIGNYSFEDGKFEYLDPPLGSIGKVLSSVSLQIRDLETGQKILGPNQRGEICLKASDMFTSYLNAPEESVTAFTDDGWFKTGDVGSFDDLQFVSVHGRAKEIFKYFNNHVSPAEIDEVLSQHPDIAEACTVGFPFTDGVNVVPRAFVTLKSGASASADEIIQFAHGKLADYKHLRGGLFIVQQLPKGSTGKVQRSLVAQMTVTSDQEPK